jgi:hypothetical protein
MIVNGGLVMRSITLAMITTLTFGLATPVLAPDRALAAPAQHNMRAMRAMMVDMKANNPQGFSACEQLARQRGYNMASDLRWSWMMFIDGCMAGRFR